MTDTIKLWMLLAKSSLPLTFTQLREQANQKQMSNKLQGMIKAGQVQFTNVGGVRHYIPVSAPKGLTMQDIAEIAAVQKGLI